MSKLPTENHFRYLMHIQPNNSQKNEALEGMISWSSCHKICEKNLGLTETANLSMAPN